MFPSEDKFDQDQAHNPQDDNLKQIDARISAKSLAIRKQQLEKILLKLIIFGLTIGTILGLGAYYLLHKFGLTKKPYQLEQERIEQEKEHELSPPVKKINDFSSSHDQYHRFEL